MAQYLKLDAVNLMLDAIGEEPVASLVSGLDDAEAAETKLDAVVRRELAKGWHFNTEGDKEKPVILTPTVDGTIPISDDILRVDTVQEQKIIDVTVRESKLYNLTDRTYVFTKPVHVSWVLNLDFEAIPYSAGNWLAHLAAYEFARSRLGSSALLNQLKEELANAWVSFSDSDADGEDANIFTDSAEMVALTYRRNRLRTYRRY